MNIANNIKRFRLLRKMSQGKLGLMIGKDQKMISFWEAGIHTPLPENISALADVLCVTVDDIKSNYKGETQ